MSLAEQARDIIEERVQEGFRFRDVLYAHLRKGWYLWSSPTAFGMARPVLSSWSDAELWGLEKSALAEIADCWHIWVAVGDVQELLDVLPFELPLLSFQHRGNEVRRLEFGRAKKLLQRYGKRSKGSTSATTTSSANSSERA